MEDNFHTKNKQNNIFLFIPQQKIEWEKIQHINNMIEKTRNIIIIIG